MPALGSKPQRLAGAGRSHKQDALWNVRSQTAIAPWILQKGHDLLQFELSLVDAGNIRKRYLCILLDIDLGTRFSDRHQSAEPLTTAYATAEKRPQAKQEHERQDPGQNTNEAATRRRSGHRDALRRQLFGQ